MKDMCGLTFCSCHQELLLEGYDGEKKVNPVDPGCGIEATFPLGGVMLPKESSTKFDEDRGQ